MEATETQPYVPMYVELRGNYRSATIGALAGALAKAQGQITNPPKDKVVNIRSDKGNYSFRYADLAACMDAIRSAFSANGLAVSQSVFVDETKATCVTEIMHESGEWRRSEIRVTASGSIKDLGGQFTYLRRYALSALVGIAPDDDADEQDDTPKPAQQTKAPAAERAKNSQTKTAAAKPEPTPTPTPKPEPTPAEADAQPVFDQIQKSNGADQADPQTAALKAEAFKLAKACDPGTTEAVLVATNARCLEWGLPVLKDQTADQLQQTLASLKRVHSLQLEITGVSEANDAVFNKKTGELDIDQTREAIRARLYQYEEQNPGSLPEDAIKKCLPVNHWGATEEQLRTIRKIYAEAAQFDVPQQSGVPF